VFDSNKILKGSFDVKDRSLKLTPGSYTIKVQIVSHDNDIIESLRYTPVRQSILKVLNLKYARSP
jgi:hypothetical protein